MTLSQALKSIVPVLLVRHWLIVFGDNLKRKTINMESLKRMGADACGIVPPKNVIKSHTNVIDTFQHKSTSVEIQAINSCRDGKNVPLPARIIANRHRLSFPVAKLICHLAQIGGAR